MLRAVRDALTWAGVWQVRAASTTPLQQDEQEDRRRATAFRYRGLSLRLLYRAVWAHGSWDTQCARPPNPETVVSSRGVRESSYTSSSPPAPARSLILVRNLRTSPPPSPLRTSSETPRGGGGPSHLPESLHFGACRQQPGRQLRAAHLRARGVRRPAREGWQAPPCEDTRLVRRWTLAQRHRSHRRAVLRCCAGGGGNAPPMRAGKGVLGGGPPAVAGAGVRPTGRHHRWKCTGSTTRQRGAKRMEAQHEACEGTSVSGFRLTS